MAKGHIITPEGHEVASDSAQWASMPADWKALACSLECPSCPTKKGEVVDHAAGENNFQNFPNIRGPRANN